MPREVELEPDATGGDPVCWLDRTCPDCAAMPSAESPDRCWRCGRPNDEFGPPPESDQHDPHRR